MSTADEDAPAVPHVSVPEDAQPDTSAAARDLAAQLRDTAGEERDDDAADRDRRADKQDDAHRRPGPTRTGDRVGAGLDRQSAADDRESAASDRAAAAEERDRAAEQIDSLMHDALTGFYTRTPGLVELEREVLKCQRTGEPFTVAFIDVDGLKETNDTEGHDAGDQLIVDVSGAVHSLLRDYDVVLRYGGDEFVCGMQGITAEDATIRFADLKQRLHQAGGRSASVGIAQLKPSESLQELIGRADVAMYEEKPRKGRRR